MHGDYSRLLSSSKFCLVAPGDGFSARMEVGAQGGGGRVRLSVGLEAEGENCEGAEPPALPQPCMQSQAVLLSAYTPRSRCCPTWFSCCLPLCPAYELLLPEQARQQGPPLGGWLSRAVVLDVQDATLNGCVPVVIMDNVHSTFENILDYSQFAVSARRCCEAA